jgi:hypothetical protein
MQNHEVHNHTASFGIPLSLITEVGMLGAGGVAQVKEHLPSKHKVLNLNPSTTKKKIIIKKK